MNEYRQVKNLKDVLAWVEGKWLGRQYQYDMVAFSLKKEAEAYLDLQYDIKQGKISSSVAEGCTNKWLKPNKPQWSMVYYCAKRAK